MCTFSGRTETHRESFAHAFQKSERIHRKENVSTRLASMCGREKERETKRERERDSEYRFVRLSCVLRHAVRVQQEKNCFDDLFFLLSFHFITVCVCVCCLPLPGSSNGARSDFRRLNAADRICWCSNIVCVCARYDTTGTQAGSSSNLNEEESKPRGERARNDHYPNPPWSRMPIHELSSLSYLAI